MGRDLGQKSSLLAFKTSFGSLFKNEMHEEERLKACDDMHRKRALEHQFLSYQFFRDEETSDEEAKRRQDVLSEILDNYYEDLPNPVEETEEDKTWRLFLARMDRRKMNPTTEKTDDGFLIHWNPEIEPELKDYSEKSVQRSSEAMKYLSLKLWASFRMRGDEKYKQYDKYEQNPLFALKEVREIVKKLEVSKAPQLFQSEYSEEENFFLHNHSIPSDVSSLLLRDFSELLIDDDKMFCKNITLSYASLFLNENYIYQISDGVLSALSVSPQLLSEEPEDVKLILLLGLFNDYPIDMAHTRFSAFSVGAIQKLWKSNFDDAQSLLYGYLIFKPKYEAVRKNLFKENHKRGVHEVREYYVIKAFLEENEIGLSKVIQNELLIDEIGNISKIDLRNFENSFSVDSEKINNESHKKLVNEIIFVFAKKLLSKDRSDKIDYAIRHDFLEKFSWFILRSPKEEIESYLKPFLDKFNSSQIIADLFKEIISAEDALNEYDNFWAVWGYFESKVVELCKKGDKYWYVEEIVMSYLFAANSWKETAIE